MSSFLRSDRCTFESAYNRQSNRKTSSLKLPLPCKDTAWVLKQCCVPFYKPACKVSACVFWQSNLAHDVLLPKFRLLNVSFLLNPPYVAACFCLILGHKTRVKPFLRFSICRVLVAIDRREWKAVQSTFQTRSGAGWDALLRVAMKAFCLTLCFGQRTD